MARHDVEHFLTVLDAAAGLEHVAEQQFLAGVMHRRRKIETAPATLRRHDRPAGERAGGIDHVLLRVPAVHAERMQFEQLAAVVLVESGNTAIGHLLLRRLRRDAGWKLAGPRHSLRAEQSAAPTAAATPSRRHETRTIAVGLAQGIVEIDEHGRTFRHGLEQCAELAERVGANGLVFVVSEFVALSRVLLDVDGEVIQPEIGHHFLQLPLGEERAGDASSLCLGGDATHAHL